ncbi:WD40 repeat-like protein [Ceraceosorus guamensis]|uniref:WD40 repeat-like protein n=1 Tax=Ceraceosorus guamensis TaxID=1522189 RepID=A0A316W995_9BASI|nr:WD40 repeat-like protein [Ceraceosorus guamensis]PWN44623.1 WD40 repeat-like protein [Ceraceosorus guamensis]
MSGERPLGGSSAVSGLSDALAQGAAYLSPFAQSAQAGASTSAAGLNEATRHLIDAAPHLFKPRMLSAAIHSSSLGVAGTSGDRARIVGWGGLPLALSRPISLSQPARSLARFGAAVASGGGLSAAELRAREDCAAILREAEAEAELGVRAQGLSIEDGSNVATAAATTTATNGEEPVSLLRGYEATRPSSLAGRARRREARGKAVDAPRLGLRAMGENARGLLSASEAHEDGENGATHGAEEAASSFKSRAKGRASIRGSRDAVIKLDESQLADQKEEIEREKEDVGVRRALIRKEISAVETKMAALVAVRDRLEHSLLQLREEELELQDEAQGVSELLSLQAHRRNMPGVAGASVASLSTNQSGQSEHATSASSSRRRKGPLFLPSEHDELPSGVAFMTLAGHTAPLTALDFSEPYGALVSAASDDGAPIVWDLSSGGEVGRLRGHEGNTRCLQVEEELCITGGSDCSIRIWDLRKVENWETRLSMNQQARDGEGAAAIVRNGDEAEGNNKDEEWDPCLSKLDGHTRAVTSLYFDEGCLITGASDKTLRQWDLNTGQCVLTMDILWAISNPGGPSTPGGSGAASRRSMAFDNSSAGGIGGPSVDFSGAFSYPSPPASDGSWEMYSDFVGGVQFWGYALASASGDGAVRMWDMRTGQAHRTLLGHTAPVTCLQFDETHIVSGSLDRSIRIWDLRTGAISDTIRYDFPVTALQFDSRKILAAAGESGVKVYNRTTMQHSTLALNGHTAPAERLRYMDRYAVTGGRDGLVKTWSL